MREPDVNYDNIDNFVNLKLLLINYFWKLITAIPTIDPVLLKDFSFLKVI
jgi:hypothetical protein